MLLYSISLCLFTLSACSLLPRGETVELNTWFQTPIPESTLVASHGIQRVSTPEQAVVTAFAKLKTSRVVPRKQPELISVEKLGFEAALEEQLVQEQDRDQWNGQPLWLVVFEGEFTFTSPGSDEQPFEGLVEVLLPEDGSGIRVMWGEKR